jgi:hypothetical protein
MNININTSQKEMNENENKETENVIINEDYSEFQKYIIKNNIYMQSKNAQLKERIKSLEEINTDNETEIDKYDERIRYMRGLLHNLYSLKEMNTLVRQDWEKCAKNNNKLFNKYIIIEGYINNTFKYYIIILFCVTVFEQFVIGTLYIFIKILFYNGVTLSLLYFLINKQYLLKSDTFKFKWENKNLSLKFVEDISNVKKEQSELIRETNEKIKEIDELEKTCVGVSVMIDNV